MTAVYAPVALPLPDHGPPPTPGHAEAHLSINERWENTARLWNERALERINQNRRRLGLEPIDNVLEYVLTDHTWLAADAAVAPVPTTPGRKIVQTGSWVLADFAPLPAKLEAFLTQGEPPIYVGFGSMLAADDVAHRLIAVARDARRRVVISKGWVGKK